MLRCFVPVSVADRRGRRPPMRACIDATASRFRHVAAQNEELKGMSSSIALSPENQKRFSRVLSGLADLAVDRNFTDARAGAEQLIRRRGELTRTEMLESVIEDRARWAAIAGGIQAAIESIPGYGQLLGAFGVLPAAALVIYERASLAVYMACVYEPRISKQQLRMIVALALLVAFVGQSTRRTLVRAALGLTGTALKTLVRRAGLRLANRLLRIFAVRITKRGISASVPIISIPINAVLTYAEIKLGARLMAMAYDLLLARPIERACARCGGTGVFEQGYGTYECCYCGGTVRVLP